MQMTIAKVAGICCILMLSVGPVSADSPDKADQVETPRLSLIDRRIAMERKLRDNPFALVPHRTTYILPFAYTASPNAAPYADSGVNLQNMEIKGQISVKVQLRRELFGGNGFLYAAYTQLVHWQAYNTEASSFFRNSNHEPEFFLTFLTDRPFWAMRLRIITFGINHQSNGRAGSFSRSWNRLFMDVIMEHGPFYISVKPWWRIPEEAKRNPTDASGDDNPDIDDYMGYGEFLGVYELGRNLFSLRGRNNFRSPNRGALELGWSFPFRSNMRGFVQYFNGYGENLLDYNVSIQRLSLGVMLIDWL